MPKIPLSPLQLKQHLFTAVNVRTNQEGRKDGPVILDQHVVHQRISEKPDRWHLEIHLNHRSAEAKHPFFYDVELHIIGIVEVDDTIDLKKRDVVAAVNGLSLLYGAAREMVLNITARAPHGPFCLPSLNFLEVLSQATPGPSSVAGPTG